MSQGTCSGATPGSGDPTEEVVGREPGHRVKEDTVKIQSVCNTSESQIEPGWQSWEERCERAHMTSWDEKL